MIWRQKKLEFWKKRTEWRTAARPSTRAGRPAPPKGACSCRCSRRGCTWSQRSLWAAPPRAALSKFGRYLPPLSWRPRRRPRCFSLCTVCRAFSRCAAEDLFSEFEEVFGRSLEFWWFLMWFLQFLIDTDILIFYAIFTLFTSIPLKIYLKAFFHF